MARPETLRTTTAANEGLQLYGFSFTYPAAASLEFSPKFSRETGSVTIRASKDSTVFVTWSPLEKMPKKAADVTDHANLNIEMIKSRTRTNLTTVEHRQEKRNGHDAVYDAVKLESRPSRLTRSKRVDEMIRSQLVHCDKTARYFVLYSVFAETDRDQQSSLFENVLSSFRCHSD